MVSLVRPGGWTVLLIGLATMAACNSSDPGKLPVYPVSGKVLYKGNPLVGALVVFEKTGGSEAASTTTGSAAPIRATGRTGADGGFQLMTYELNDGAPAGEYLVAIASRPSRGEGNLLNTDRTVTKGNPDVLRNRYAEPKSSGLKATVEPKTNEIPTFDLK